jgi:hypothetical protein
VDHQRFLEAFMRATWRIATLGAFGLVGLTLTGCGTSYDNPLVQVNPETPGTNDTIRVQYEEHPGVDNRVEWYRDGELVDDLTTEVPARLTQRGQNWRVVVTPIDEETGEEYAASEVTVAIVNSVPYGIVTFNPAEGQAGVDLVANPGFTDPDGDTVSYRFSWKRNGNDAGNTTDTVAGDLLTSGDIWEVTIVGADDQGDSEPVIGSAQVANSAPAVAGARISPDVLFDDSTASCVGVGFTDPDGDAEGYKTLWLVNGIPVADTATLEGDKFDRGQTIACELTPFDGIDSGPPVVSPSVVVGNGIPSIGSLTIDGPTQTRNAPLTFTAADVVDADGDEVALDVWWLVNGRGVSKELTLSPTLFKRGSVVEVQATPSDGFSVGDTVLSSRVTIQNAPPVIQESEFNSLPLYSDTVIVPENEVVDNDGDEIVLTYAWTVNGSAAGDDTGMLDGTVAFDRGDTVQYTLTANDGTDDGVPFVSESVTVVNKAPDDADADVTPRPPDDDDDILCEIFEDSVDADGDTVTYTFTWDLDGAPYTGLTDTTVHTGDTIPAAATELGDVWTCLLTASDGTDDGNTLELETVVRPTEAVYYIEDKTGLGGAGTTCTGGDGNTGYYGNFYYTAGLEYKFEDLYRTSTDSVTMRWRQGFARTTSTYRYVYINGVSLYGNLGIAQSTTCDSGRTYGLTISGISSIWSTGATNSIRIAPPCCSYIDLGAYWDEDYKYGELTVNED